MPAPPHPGRPSVLDGVRREIRLRHLSPRTEDACIGWIRRFGQYCRGRTVSQLDEQDIARYLSDLAGLTDVAARYTPDRRPNFDIDLPSWLARFNKEIFGSLYIIGILWTLAAWFSVRAGGT